MSAPSRRFRSIVAALVAVTFMTASEAVAQRRGGGGRNGPEPTGATQLSITVPRGLSTTAPIPAENALTPEKVTLGRLLFFDTSLSADRSVSCASCHRPELGFADSARLSVGIHGRLSARNSPTLLNRVYGRSLFWDGRARTLEQAVLMPIQDTMEMSMQLPELVRRVSMDQNYPALFARAFPGNAITETTIARALASYVRTLLTGDSPFDRLQSGDATALSPSALRGRDLFFGRANCSDCHRGPNFTDERLHDDAVSASDRARFKTPTLRNVELTAPYMHDGSIRTLEDVVEFYNRGGNDTASRNGRGGRGGEIRPLRLSAEQRSDLVAFLRALTGPVVEARPAGPN
jgi:cytochrome c peroxidase